jgi:uncharacterized membrane protein YphA (DoxX/SURF4 family)
MHPEAPASTRVPSRAALYAGWASSVLPAALLLFSASMKFLASPATAEMFGHLGWPEGSAVPLGAVELTCTALFLVPRTAVLGAILLAGYMGGAIATHARIGEPLFVQAGLGVVVWLGLYLREPRLRDLIPLRQPALSTRPVESEQQGTRHERTADQRIS